MTELRRSAEQKQKLDAGEFLEVLRVPFDQAVTMVRDGRITDSKSVAGILWADKWVAR